MEDDDWVKFAHVLWATHHRDSKKQILLKYRQAWTSLYSTEPMIQEGGPINFLNNTDYVCNKPVPWRPEVERRFSNFHLDPKPSTSVPREDTPPTRDQISLPTVLTNVTSTDSLLQQQLFEVFSTLDINIDTCGSFPRITNGFFPNYVSHIKHGFQNACLTVIFPIIPQYAVTRGSSPSADIGSVVIDQSDADILLKVDPRCLEYSQDQTRCERGKARYRCNSWLCLGFEMLEHKNIWDIKFLNWPAFCHAVLNQMGSDWEMISAAHLLIGGVNFTNNFLETSSSVYDLSKEEMMRMWNGLVLLAQSITIWPDPRDLMMAGSKLFLECILKEVAHFMGDSHPQSVVVQPSVEIVDKIVKGDLVAVLKREFSSHGHHVFSKHTKNAVKKLENRLVDEENAYDGYQHFSRPLWFLTPYNASLAYMGELRVFLVNGVLFQSVITTPRPGDIHALDILEPIIFTPLSDLSLTFQQRREGTVPWLASATLSPHQQQNDFVEYVLRSLFLLVHAEEHVTKRRSCMRIFLRMDVCVFQTNGKFKYMINELTRSHQTSLFNEWWSGKMDFGIQDLAKVLHFAAYVDDCQRKIIDIP